MKNDFLKRFLEDEKYLQNPPKETKKFIEFCKKRGIETNEKELEFFEKEGLLFPIIRIDRPVGEEERIKFINKKDGKTHWRPAIYGLKNGEEEIERYIEPYYSDYGFDNNISHLLGWLKEGNLFDPSMKPFQDWATFKDKELNNQSQRFVSFYSSFQIYWLDILKEQFYTGYPENFEKRKKRLKREYENFVPVIKFLLFIQTAYTPYGKSGSGNIQVSGNKWFEKRKIFDSKEELDLSKLSIEDIVKWYARFSRISMKLLGVKRDDWMQLWKNINWRKKDELEGSVRLGVEFLQWSLMLKKFIEEHLGREILDIDEMTNINELDVLNFVPKEMDQYGRLLRASRNRDYTDPEDGINYYYDRYKRLFYLANDFGLDYQPRVMVFVEGKTEEEILPKVFEWRSGNTPENYGIEFVNFKGVGNLLSTAKIAKELDTVIKELQKEERLLLISNSNQKRLNEVIKKLKKSKVIISNWTSFISYNLEKWQIIPFFASDEEGNAKHFLDAETPIEFKGEKYNVPKKWQYLWGIDNENQPFEGKDFEFANFSDDEIALAISEVLGVEIDAKDVEIVRGRGNGINKIDSENPQIKKNKIKIAKKLFENLFNKYEKDNDKSILERPVFKLIDKILDLAALNHLPVDRGVEIKNKEIIERWFKEKEIIVTAWNNGKHHSNGAGYGIKINENDRDEYFKNEWKTAILELQNVKKAIEVNVNKPSFWGPQCRELISKDIGIWLINNEKAPWPKGTPPKLKMIPVADNKFRLELIP